MGIGKTIVLTAAAMLTAEIVHSLYQDYGNEIVKAVKNIVFKRVNVDTVNY